MFLLFLLWILVYLFFWKYYALKKWNPAVFFQTQPFWSQKKKQKNYLKLLKHWEFFTKPGFFVKYLVKTQKITEKLLLLDNPVTLDSFSRLKQLILNIGLLYFWLYLFFGTVSWSNSLWILSFFLLLFFLPDLWIQTQKERQEAVLAQEIPYFIDLLSFTLSSGLNIEQALTFLSHKKPQAIAKIVNKKLRELDYGVSLETVLKDLKRIVPNESFGHFLSSISQAQKLGVPLGHTLEIQSKLIRTRRRQRAEELSRTAAVKISIPLVLFIFPALLMLYIGPGILHLIWS